MFVLLIIGSILLILAIINWIQSEGFIQKLKDFFLEGSSSDEVSAQKHYVAGGGSVAIFENEDLDDYAYDDESDYLDDDDNDEDSDSWN